MRSRDLFSLLSMCDLAFRAAAPPSHSLLILYPIRDVLSMEYRVIGRFLLHELFVAHTEVKNARKNVVGNEHSVGGEAIVLAVALDKTVFYVLVSRTPYFSLKETPKRSSKARMLTPSSRRIPSMTYSSMLSRERILSQLAMMLMSEPIISMPSM